MTFPTISVWYNLCVCLYELCTNIVEIAGIKLQLQPIFFIEIMHSKLKLRKLRHHDYYTRLESSAPLRGASF